MDRAARLAQFVSDRHPAQDSLVEALCQDHVGTYLLPFLCRWTDDGWVNADTGLAIDAEVVGWRMRPIPSGFGRRASAR
jgi:hypothetical protein